jgi:protein-disulfide isomerase
MHRGLVYNPGVKPMPVRAMQKLVFPALLAVSTLVLATLALGGASCDKKSSATPNDDKELANAIDKIENAKEPVNQDPIPGVDLSKLDSKKQELFYRLADSLPSPCGQAHSLRKSLTEDTSCKRAPFAARYVISMLGDEAELKDIQEFYTKRYRTPGEAQKFQLSESVPHSGPVDAPVKVVEFFDYGCPGCKSFAPLLDEALSRFPNEAVLFYKQFPLPSHTLSGPAAQAALAAAQQGKYKEMHDLLFARQPQHQESQLREYAQSLGLDMGKFEADFKAAAATVKADVAEGDAAHVHGTPTLFINGIEYTGPMHPDYLALWIQEELAVNR